MNNEQQPPVRDQCISQTNVRALLDLIGRQANTGGADVDFYRALERIVDECQGEWHGDCAELSRDLARHGVAMCPSASAQRLRYENGTLALGGYCVEARRMRGGRYHYTIRRCAEAQQ